MNQIRLNVYPNYVVDCPPRMRVGVVCTKCGREIRRGDCGTPHRPGSAQMMYKRILE